MLFTGVCYALSTPLGVHIGYLMGQDRWLQVLGELVILIMLQTMAPVMWVKAQTLDLKEDGTGPQKQNKE
jgi:ABC-type nitrate/sulfonate/bicarbonate transport system permease component